jgi:putative restriction endonuclease
MAYWWVSQNQTFRHEREGGYLWAPAIDKAGKTPFHWQTMHDVRPGDLVFSFVDQTIKALGVAQSSARPATRPLEFTDQELWKQDGFRIDVVYEDVKPPLNIPLVSSELSKLLPSTHSPLNRNGTGNQGYLFPLPDGAGRYLLSHVGRDAALGLQHGDELAVKAITRSTLTLTEKQAVIQARVGQGRFRNDLLRMWDGRCAITGIALTQLLRASHIKPWASSNNRERIDTYNGLLLAANYDAAFDAGIISFDDSGALLCKPLVDPTELLRAGIDTTGRLRIMREEMLPYLDFHRRNLANLAPA